MTATFASESYTQVIADILPLLPQHWEEIEMYTNAVALKPDLARYEAMDRMGALRIFTVRVGGGLVGYALYFVHAHPHYSEDLWSVSDIIWVHPSHRQGRLGMQLMQFAEEGLREAGVSVMQTTTKFAHPALGRLMDHLGHEAVECVYAKLLKKVA